jgi:hypothetical protein
VSSHYTTPVFDDAVDAEDRREIARRKALLQAKEQARDRVRAEFPVVTAFADALRTQFGDGVRILWAIEGGQYVGRPPKQVLNEYDDKNQLRALRLINTGHQNTAGS